MMDFAFVLANKQKIIVIIITTTRRIRREEDKLGVALNKKDKTS